MARVWFVATDAIPLIFGLVVSFAAGFALCFWLFWGEHLTVKREPNLIVKP